MIEPAEGDEFHGYWFAFPVSSFLRDRDPDGPPGEPIVRPRRNASVELALSRDVGRVP